MKKLMVMATVIVLGFAAQAEATFTFTGMDEERYAGYTFYEFTGSNLSGTDVDSFISDSLDEFDKYFLANSALAEFDSSTWTEHYSKTKEIYDPISMTGNVIVDDYYETGDESKEWWVMLLGVEDGIAAGHKYVLFDAASAFSDTDTLAPTFDMLNVAVRQTGSLNSDAAPEPTSGLLMLLGMAGLALKRKRA